MGGTKARAAGTNVRRVARAVTALVTVLLFTTACGSAATTEPDIVAAAATVAPSSKSTTPPSATPTPAPVVAVTDEQLVEAVAFESSRLDDASLAAGTTVVSTAGAPGERTTIFRVTRTDGVETAREQVSSAVTRPPVTEVVQVGTYVAPPPEPAPAAPESGGCDPNYSGACVPIASDVDCAGGSGNGPAYVRGPVTIIGSDIYELDGKDNDGIGCES